MVPPHTAVIFMLSADAKSGELKSSYAPDLYTRQEVSGFNWIFRNRKEGVYILAVNKNSSGTYVKGFIESESRKGMYHYVVAFIGQSREIVGGGFCECESRHYYGKPCKHVLSLRNMYEKHKEELDRLAAPYPELRR